MYNISFKKRRIFLQYVHFLNLSSSIINQAVYRPLIWTDFRRCCSSAVVLLPSLSSALWDVTSSQTLLLSLQVYRYTTAARVFYWLLFAFPPAAGVKSHFSDLLLNVCRNPRNKCNVSVLRIITFSVAGEMRFNSKIWPWDTFLK